LAAVNAQREEGPLLRAGEGHEEGVQFLHVTGVVPGFLNICWRLAKKAASRVSGWAARGDC
jgi:hypothetical protein